jgi:predicted alpha/beta hydrolase family esterase
MRLGDPASPSDRGPRVGRGPVRYPGSRMGDLAYVFLAGIGNSAADHWQTRWYDELRARVPTYWVEHADWNRVSRDRWIDELDALMLRARATSSPDARIVFVAHSLGCLLAAEWLAQHPASNVAHALLVAPPDVEGVRFPSDAVGFRKGCTLGPLPCRATLVASQDDPYGDIAYARRLADRWKVRLADVGCKGHINAESQLGAWPEGRRLLGELLGHAMEK